MGLHLYPTLYFLHFFLVGGSKSTVYNCQTDSTREGKQVYANDLSMYQYAMKTPPEMRVSFTSSEVPVTLHYT